MKKTINAKIVADSISPQGDRITTFLLTYPRFIHPEVMTHRMFSRGSASSRAIPFNRMLKMVEEDPFIPIAWQKDHPGMQGVEYLNDNLSIQFATSNWLSAKNDAIKWAESLNSHINGYESITKQLCNRFLEPFMWHTALVTSTEYDNFFELRCPKYEYKYPGETQVYNTFKSKKDWLKYNNYKMNLTEGGVEPPQTDLDWLLLSKSGAEIHIQTLAESMWDAMNESIPKKLQPGEWHIPFGDRMEIPSLINLATKQITKNKPEYSPDVHEIQIVIDNISIKIATARCGRLSYMTFDNEINYEKDIQLHDKLLKDKHMSPFEHCARVMSNDEYAHFYKGRLVTREFEVEECGENYLIVSSNDENYGWCNNFKGFIPYRYIIENELSI